MTVKELYLKLCDYIPESLRLPWDNDGMMLCPDSEEEVNNVLIALDVTEEIVDYAIKRGFGLIISHHPLIFKPIASLTEDNHISRKVIKLISNNISVFSFHTRLDIVYGGVNDRLASILGIENVKAFGEDNLGRIGTIAEECELEVFAEKVKNILGSDQVKISDGYNMVKTVAVVGGDGKDFVLDAIKAGADTYISGRISYNIMEEASEMGINLIEAGHYFTEFPITVRLAELVAKFDGNALIEIADTNMIKTI